VKIYYKCLKQLIFVMGSDRLSKLLNILQSGESQLGVLSTKTTKVSAMT